MLERPAAEPVVRIEKYNIGIRHSLNHACYPFVSHGGGYRNSVEYGTSRPNRKALERGNTRLLQRNKLIVQLVVKRPPRRLALVFNMPAIRPPVVAWKVIPRNAEQAIVLRDATKEGKLQVVRNVGRVLVPHRVLPP
jgi:hypothetical protein